MDQVAGNSGLIEGMFPSILITQFDNFSTRRLPQASNRTQHISFQCCGFSCPRRTTRNVLLCGTPTNTGHVARYRVKHAARRGSFRSQGLPSTQYTAEPGLPVCSRLSISPTSAPGLAAPFPRQDGRRGRAPGSRIPETWFGFYSSHWCELSQVFRVF